MEPFEAGFLDRPERPNGDAIALTHGAGSNCKAPLLVTIAEAFAAAGFLVYRYDLPFRQKRQHGPPFPAMAAADRDGVRAAISALTALVSGRVLAGGHSYGGRQTTIAAAQSPLAHGLLLLSYPLHPPRKPLELRTAHFAELRTPSLFVHGARDPFGAPDEMRLALEGLPARHDLLIVEGAGHDLGKRQDKLASEIVLRASTFLLGPN